MSAVTGAGPKVPGDLAVASGGNIQYGDMLRVPQTTVSWSKSEIGQAAARLLIEMIEGKKGEKPTDHRRVRHLP